MAVFKGQCEKEKIRNSEPKNNFLKNLENFLENVILICIEGVTQSISFSDPSIKRINFFKEDSSLMRKELEILHSDVLF